MGLSDGTQGMIKGKWGGQLCDMQLTSKLNFLNRETWEDSLIVIKSFTAIRYTL